MNVSQLRKESAIAKPGVVKSVVDIPAVFSKPYTGSSVSEAPLEELQNEVDNNSSSSMGNLQISTEQDHSPSQKSEVLLHKPKPHKNKYKRVWAGITDPSRTGTPSLHRASESFFSIIWSEAGIIQPLESFLADSSVYLNTLHNFHIPRSSEVVIYKDPGCIKRLKRLLPYFPLVPEVALHVQVFGKGAAIPLQTSIASQILQSVKTTSSQLEIDMTQTTFIFSGDHTYAKHLGLHPRKKEATATEFRYAKPLEVNIHKCAMAKSKVKLQVTFAPQTYVRFSNIPLYLLKLLQRAHDAFPLLFGEVKGSIEFAIVQPFRHKLHLDFLTAYNKFHGAMYLLRVSFLGVKHVTQCFEVECSEVG